MFLEIQGKQIHYTRVGSGEPMLFVHGWGGSSESLQALAQLANKDYKTFVIDLPGFGSSEKPDTEWGVEEYAQVLLEFLEQMGIDSVTYFGHSFGGSLGIYIAAHQPKKIKQLILCASSYKRRKTASKKHLLLKQTLQRLPGYDQLRRTFLMPFYRIFFPHSDISKFPALESNFRKIIIHDLTPEVGEITCPTLIVWGALDTATPVELAQELHKTIKESQLEIFPSEGHNLPLKHPEKVWGKMKKFLTL